MIEFKKRIKAQSKNILSVVFVSLIFVQPAASRIAAVTVADEVNKALAITQSQQELLNNNISYYANKPTDLDPYTLINDALIAGFISPTPAMFEREDFLAERPHREMILENMVKAGPDTLVLPNSSIRINRFAKDFDVVVVINTAISGKVALRQVGYLYLKNKSIDGSNESFELKNTFLVSSGVPTNGEKPVLYRDGSIVMQQDGVTPKTVKYWKGTEAGYFPVQFIEHPHISALRVLSKDTIDAELAPPYVLKYFIGYNPKDGQGFHVEKVIAHKSLSHGCIRARSKTAESVYKEVAQSRVGTNQSKDETVDRYMNKISGLIKTVVKIPTEIETMSTKTSAERRRKSIAQTKFLENELQDKLGDYNLVGKFRTLFIVNGAPDIEYSNLVLESELADLIQPNDG